MIAGICFPLLLPWLGVAALNWFCENVAFGLLESFAPLLLTYVGKCQLESPAVHPRKNETWVLSQRAAERNQSPQDSLRL